MDDAIFKNFDVSQIVNCYRLPGKPCKLLNAAPRRYHAFCFFLSGESHYVYGDTVYATGKNSFLFLPQGVPYTIKRFTRIDCIVIDFKTFQDESRSPYLRNFESGNKEFENLFASALARYCETCPSDAAMKSVLYAVIAKLQKLELAQYAPSAGRSFIDPALEYLNKHFTDGDLSTRMLANLCNMSEPYFTEKFKIYTGITPKQYVIQLRLHFARNLLHTGDCPIADVAESSGFKNAYYFSRLFKEKTGMTPKEYRDSAN